MSQLLRKTTAIVSAASIIALPFEAPIASAQNVLPQGGSVVGGSATISQPSASGLSINQSSARAIINWNTFSIGQPNNVTFYQPNSSAAALNRVTSATPSTIAGQLNANGQVFLVNPNGIAITTTGTVNVGGGFVASTLDISNKDFLNGNLNFRGNGASGPVSNQGKITVAPGGFVGLLGGTVSNSGTISVPLGRVALGSGEMVTLDVNGDGFMQVAIPTGATANGRSLIEVAGAINAAGGKIQVSAATVAQAIRDAVNVSGSLSATSLAGRDGAVMLGGGPGGNVKISGSIDVSGTTSAGKLLTTGANVEVSGAKLNAQSLQGAGGSIIITALNSIVLKGSSLDASGGAGGGGIRIGGDFHGLGSIGTAATTIVDEKTTINADAIVNGPGGTVVLWSGQLTTFAGLISAKGGAQGGNGGSVEVSSKGVLAYRGVTDLSAVKGAFGTLLLDPYNIIISSAADSGGSLAGGAFTPGADDSVLNATTLTTALGLANVIVSTTGAGTQVGNITVNAPITWASASTLTLSADNNIALNSAISGANGGLTLNAVGTITASAAVNVGTFTLQGGTWNQVAASLPSFAANDFRISGGTFIRALGGNGTVATPYQLADIYGVQGIGSTTTTLSQNYVLANNINASGTANWNGGSGFKPIGKFAFPFANPFTGTFDGQNNTISNLTISATDNNGTGLFGYVDGQLGVGGTVKNIGLLNTTITGFRSQVGALVGEIDNGAIVQNAYSTGTVSGFVNVGGLVGLITGGTSIVTQSHSAVTVTGNTNVGGLVGKNNGTITQSYATGAVDGSTTGTGGLLGWNNVAGAVVSYSYATGTVTGTSGSSDQVGGLVGYSDGTVTQSYATGAVSGRSQVGGLVGESGLAVSFSYATGAVVGTGQDVGGLLGRSRNAGTVTQSYATGSVSGTVTNIGGLVGRNGTNTVDLSYWDVNTTGQSNGYGSNSGSWNPSIAAGNSATIGGLTTTQFFTAANFSSWTFGTSPLGSANTCAGACWVIVNTDGTFNNAGGAAGGTRPMLLSEYSTTIRTAHQLQLVMLNLAASYTVANNIDLGPALTATGSVWSSAGFVPIGSNATPFTGTFNGQNNVISNLFINRTTNTPAGDYTGLFGFISSALVQNVSLSGGTVTGANYTGALVGKNFNGTIDTTNASTNVVGNTYVGGLVGHNDPGTVSNSSSTGTVTGRVDVGGLVGFNDTGSVVSQTSASGAVAGSANVGGLVGVNLGTIINSTSTGPVTIIVTPAGNGTNVGGLVGYNTASGHVSVSNSSGSVNGTTNVGGLIGSNEGVINQVSSTSSVSGTTNVGGLIGANSLGAVVTQGSASGSATGNSNVGGLIGSNSGDVSQVTSTSSVSGTTNVGGLVGENTVTGKVVQATWNIDESGASNGVGSNSGLFVAIGINNPTNPTTNPTTPEPNGNPSTTNGIIIATTVRSGENSILSADSDGTGSGTSNSKDKKKGCSAGAIAGSLKEAGTVVLFSGRGSGC